MFWWLSIALRPCMCKPIYIWPCHIVIFLLSPHLLRCFYVNLNFLRWLLFCDTWWCNICTDHISIKSWNVNKKCTNLFSSNSEETKICLPFKFYLILEISLTLWVCDLFPILTDWLSLYAYFNIFFLSGICHLPKQEWMIKTHNCVVLI